jgi:hypothetical protein
MLFAANSTSLIQRVRLLNDAGDPIIGVAHNSGSLEIAYNLQSDGLWVVTTLVAGTLGTYLANSWVAIGAGLYQWCPPNAAIVANATTLVRATYAANAPQYGKIEARLPKVDASAAVELDSSALRAALGLDAADLDDQLDAILAASGGGDWSDAEKAQIRYRLGLDGTATAPEDPDEEPIVITPGSGNFTTGYLTCLDEAGEALADCPVYWKMIEAPASDTGYAYDASRASTESASNGVAQLERMVKGATYLVFRGKEEDGVVVTIPTSAGTTYELPSLRGF